jgi:hypothetical protein
MNVLYECQSRAHVCACACLRVGVGSQLKYSKNFTAYSCESEAETSILSSLQAVRNVASCEQTSFTQKNHDLFLIDIEYRHAKTSVFNKHVSTTTCSWKLDASIIHSSITCFFKFNIFTYFLQDILFNQKHALGMKTRYLKSVHMESAMYLNVNLRKIHFNIICSSPWSSN